MKILITTDWYKSAVNGVVTSVRNLEKGLRQRGHDVKIITLSQTRSSYTDGDVTYIGSLNAGKIYPCARIKIPLKSKLIANIIKWKPDVIHSQCEFSTFSLARKISDITGAPIVHTYHTIYEDYTHYFSPSIKLGRHAVKLFTRHIARHVDCMIAPTKKVENILNEYNCKIPIEVVPTGLDFNMILSDKNDNERYEFRRSLGISENKKVILYTGRLAEEKNLDEIIEYLSRYKSEDIVFLVVGDGPYREATEKKINECGLSDITIMTGMVKYSDIKNYYAAGDIFVSASQSETQGLTYIEGLLNGLVLLCKKDKCLEDVLSDGINGYAYTSENDFSKYLSSLLTKDISNLKDNAVRIAKQKFSLENFAESAEKIYRIAIKNRIFKNMVCA